ncbi:DUF2235 domain-containing protein [Shewanella surugensis]|uniref:DUF2235 domain-containing protein n=1 Tax=Shewanella surugensis TaxID=212020 RepID=A0ABT0L9K2_9GAMM|nr:DUF2235 domain-containing protein [Shewanella surugensis]MCL1124045.1 DUF2235 domain-containing protein [Shewanella surugensis]
MSKNIVLFSDGTGQEGGVKFNTNVYKTFNMIEERSGKQIAHYSKGIGTDWRQITGSLFGVGMTDNMIECYRFLFDHYHVGDKVYLFGFSRGAATVRSLSRFIQLFGILPKSRPELIKQALKIYKIKNTKKRQQQAALFISKNKNVECDITFMGVWDTVAAMGLPNRLFDSMLSKIPPFKHKFHDFKISENIKHAYHALAIDDTRAIFHPMLWQKKAHSQQTVKQVWFSGVHTDVGGGYENDGLSNISLVWMLDHASSHGLIIHNDIEINQDISAKMHNESIGVSARLFEQKKRTWNTDIEDKPTVHASVLQRQLNPINEVHPEYTPWILKDEYYIEPWNQNTYLPQKAA